MKVIVYFVNYRTLHKGYYICIAVREASSNDTDKLSELPFSQVSAAIVLDQSSSSIEQSTSNSYLPNLNEQECDKLRELEVTDVADVLSNATSQTLHKKKIYSFKVTQALLNSSLFKEWLVEDPTQKGRPYCKICHRSIKASNKKDLVLHSQRNAHLTQALVMKNQVAAHQMETVKSLRSKEESSKSLVTLGCHGG